MDVYKAIRKVIFKTDLSVDSLHFLRQIIGSKFGFKSEYVKLADYRIQILEKRAERSLLKNYSTEVKKRVKKGLIDSGFCAHEFDLVKRSRKKNWTGVHSVYNKGYTRKKSSIIEFNRGRYSYRVKFIKWEYAPKITSYVNYTPKWVNVNLENKSYRIRYAGKYFHFGLVNGRFALIHTKTDKYLFLTAFDIVYHLPRIRKNLNRIIKQK